MRTTINIREQALSLCRKKVAATGKSLGEVVSAAILESFSKKAQGGKRRRYDLPVSGSGGLQPGVDLDDSAALEEIMDGLR